MICYQQDGRTVKMLALAALVGVHICAQTVAGFRSYAEDVVCRFEGKQHHKVQSVLRRLNESFDVWASNGKFGDIQVSRTIAGSLEGCRVIIDDIDEAMEATFYSGDATDANDGVGRWAGDGGSLIGSGFFDEYQRLDGLYEWLARLAEAHPEFVHVETVGESADGHELKGVRLSDSRSGRTPSNKTVVIMGGIHAREWISVSTACYLLAALVDDFADPSSEVSYLGELDFLILPVFNPDGYRYSWEHDRLWRKNRQSTHVAHCPGIDLDHSFSFKWHAKSRHPCSEEYSGEKPLQAREAESWDSYLRRNKDVYNILGYLDLHSYSEEILYPYAYTCKRVPLDLENLLELAYGLAKAVRSQSGKKYSVKSACEDRGSALQPELGAGSALDYMYHHKVPWAFQMKLRDSGTHGFLVPPSYIRPIGEEVYAAVKYFCGFILDPEF